MHEVCTSKEWLAEVVELAGDAIICIDDDQDVLFFNYVAEEIFGYTPEEIVGRPLSILLPERFRTAHAQHVREFGTSSVTVRKRRERSMVRGLRKDGEEFPAEASIAKTMVGERRVYSVVLRDVTERTHAREALERREAAIRELYRIDSDPTLDLDRKIIAYLEFGCRVFDLDQGIVFRAVGDRYEVIHACPESDAIHRGSFLREGHVYCDRTLRASAPVGFAHAEKSEGETHPCCGWSHLEAYLGSPVFVGEEAMGILNFSSPNPRGRPISEAERDLVCLMSRWIGNELHRQERHTADKLLAAAGRVAVSTLDYEAAVQEIAHVTVDSMGGACALFVTNGDAELQLAGAATEDLDWDAALRPHQGRELLDSSVFRMGEVLRTGEPHIAVTNDDVLSMHDWRESKTGVEATDPEPRFDPESVMVVPLSVKGEQFGVMLLGSRSPGCYQKRDLLWAVRLAEGASAALTNARAHQAAKDAVLRRNDLLAFVAHDLRNPLSAIAMSVEHLLDSPLDDAHGDKTHGRLEGVLSAANRMETLIQDLLDLQLLEEGRLRIQPTDTPAADLLAEAIRGVQVQIEERALTLESDAKEGLVVRVDRNRVLRLLTNLLDNALKFSDKGGRITLKAEKRNEDVLFSVSDEGIGIAEERLPKLFDRFARTDAERGGGAGLGLDIARQIVEAHGGAMWVESKLGAGTTFYFTLPRA